MNTVKRPQEVTGHYKFKEKEINEMIEGRGIEDRID
jgi:hypothetical protein